MSTFHGHSEPAPDGEGNQDAFIVSPTRDGGLLLLVCDGMGGMGRGAEASRLATRELEERLRGGADGEGLRQALEHTDLELRRTLVDEGPGRPGCTAVAVLVRDNRAIVGWAGDARAMQIRGSYVRNHSVDHKLVEELVSSGTLTREQARAGRMSHVVTRCLGGRRSTDEAAGPEIADAPWELAPGDAIVLCSDGLTDVVDQSEIPGLIAGCSVADAVGVLIRTASERGTHDDTTVIVYRHPVALAASEPAAGLPGAIRRADPLLDLATPASNATWPPMERARTPEAPADRSGSLSWYLLAAGVACLVLAAGLIIAWLGGMLG